MDNALSVASIALGNSKLFIGLCVILINVGSRHVMGEVTRTQNYILTLPIFKYITLFCMCFLTTRDVRTSIVLTVSFYLAVKSLLNEESRFNIIPGFILKKLHLEQAKYADEMVKEEVEEEER